mgnify:CR=1 FL=1
MITGTVKFFNNDKGYGFIAPEDGSSDAFVHISAVERAGMATLNKDQRVSYELTHPPLASSRSAFRRSQRFRREREAGSIQMVETSIHASG